MRMHLTLVDPPPRSERAARALAAVIRRHAPRRVWRELGFGVKFALVIAVVGILIASLPLSLASRESRFEAAQRATDKAGVVANVIAAQQRALRSFAAGMAEELASPLETGDTAAVTSALADYSRVNRPEDVVGVRGVVTAAVRDGTPLSAGDPLLGAVPRTPATAVLRGTDGEPWLVAAVRPGARSSEVAFIARPVDAAFIAMLTGTVATAVDPASVAVVRGDRVAAAGSALLGRRLTPGSRVEGVAGPQRGAQLVEADGRQAAIAVMDVGSGYGVAVATPLSSAGAPWQPLLLLLGLIAVAMLAVILVVQTDLQRPLHRLGRAVAALARGEYDAPIPQMGNQEIARLAAGFDVMRRQLHATIVSAQARADIASELNSPQPLESALRQVTAMLASATSAACAFLVVARSEMTESFTVVEGAPLDIDVDTALAEGGPIGAALRHGGADALLVGAMPNTFEARTGLRNFCVAPMRMGPSVLGVIGVAGDEHAFDSTDSGLVATSAEQTALALERYRFIAVMEQQASTDDLTGLYNHRFLVDYLGQQVALAERLGTPLAVLVVDIDHFKRVNDTYGHPAGDAVLTAFASTLSGSVRRADLAARYGGEEFIVVMSNTHAGDARLVAEKIRAAVAALSVPVDLGVVIALTVSVGVAAYPDDTSSAAELLAMADAALYDAKRAGRNRVCVATGSRNLEGTGSVTGVVRPGRSSK